MQRLIRDLTREVDALVESGEIDEYRFDRGHHQSKIRFRHGATWSYVPYSETPRTPNVHKYVRQQIRRKVREA